MELIMALVDTGFSLKTGIAWGILTNELFIIE